MSQPILAVDDLHVEFRTDEGVVRAVSGVSFQLSPGETLGIVGESGSGKSVTNLAMMGLIPQPPGRITAGRALYRGEDLLRAPRSRLRQVRGRRIAMIFQDSLTSLNPFLTVEEQITEMTRPRRGHTPAQARKHAIEWLERVGIPGAARRVRNYPHEFSGGMRQRVMIAMALCCSPEILIADEPTTALDVTIQAQILELLQELQRDQGMAIILITHDLGVVAHSCHRVLVMYAGKIVEKADLDPLFAAPRHPYTLGLMESMPRIDEAAREQLLPIAGQPPDLTELPPGCSFNPRCPFMVDRCLQEVPPLFEAPHGGKYACFIDVNTAPRREVQHDS